MDINALHREDHGPTNPTTSVRQAAELPDISVAKKTEFRGTLSRVGMRNIEMPILFVVGSGSPLLLPAKVNAFVSLDDADAKGIHMSRLYLELKQNFLQKPLSAETLKEILQKFLNTHKDLSQTAEIEIRFQVPVERKALLSGERGYRQYPAYYKAKLSSDGAFDLVMGTEILYSSTCPCSAALSQHLQQEAFLEKFQNKPLVSTVDVANWLGQEEALAGVPHSQRSMGRVQIRTPQVSLGFIELIDRLEKAVATPVQAAVKRMDEQEFARLNAKNLMFCEDAARRFKDALEADARIEDYFIHVEHNESLHPHDAVSQVVKGISGGFTPN